MFHPGKEDGFRRIGTAMERIEKGSRAVVDPLLPGPSAPIVNQTWETDVRLAMEGQSPKKSRAIIYTIALTFAALLLWAGISPLDEVVRGSGKVIPSGGTQIVQSVDGGMVEAVLVHESDHVTRGQILVQVDPTRSGSALGQQEAKMQTLTAKAARLRALSRGEPFEPSVDLIKAIPDIVDQERRLYRASLEELSSKIQVIQDQANQRRHELSEARSRYAQMSRAYDLAKQELELTKPLLKSGAVPKVDVMRLERDLARSRGERDQAGAQISRAREALEESKSQIRETELRFRNQWRNDLTATMGEMESLSRGNQALADRLIHSAIRSPIQGIVKRLTVNTTGAVIMPGGVVAEIVPEDDALVVEAHLAPKDRAFVQTGQAATVKFTAYEYAIYGGLDGKVASITPDTVSDQRGGTFYQVRIVTDKTEFGDDLPILPGMVAQVDIVTGKKTVLAYLLKPLLRARAGALRER